MPHERRAPTRVTEGQVASWGMPEGGMGAVADAIRKAAEGFGAEVRVSVLENTHKTVT